MPEHGSDSARLLAAASFAAKRHRDQRRKGADATPYINHPLAVAETLSEVGGVTDTDILSAALLHDTIEDTETTPAELEETFGPTVRRLVEEVSDDKTLPKANRKLQQIEHAAHISHSAKLIKLADKICNVTDVVHNPPTAWSLERRREYLNWSERVIVGCRGSNPALEARFDALLREGRKVLSSIAGNVDDKPVG